MKLIRVKKPNDLRYEHKPENGTRITMPIAFRLRRKSSGFKNILANPFGVVK